MSAWTPTKCYDLVPPLSKCIDSWKPKDCALVALGIAEDYAKGLLLITFQSSTLVIFF